jgi:putative ABC transport system permease protein
MRKDGREVERLQLPLRVAFHISMQSVRIRFWRSVITAAGTVLGIAFLVSVLTAMMIQRNSGAFTDPTEKYRMTWLVIMSLLVCLVGITNAMLMSVTERYKEIGTMKCLGAYDIFIVELFFIESALVGFIASIIGWFLGVFAVVLVKLFGEGFKVFRLDFSGGGVSVSAPVHSHRHTAVSDCHYYSCAGGGADACGCCTARGSLTGGVHLWRFSHRRIRPLLPAPSISCGAKMW